MVTAVVRAGKGGWAAITRWAATATDAPIIVLASRPGSGPGPEVIVLASRPGSGRGPEVIVLAAVDPARVAWSAGVRPAPDDVVPNAA